MSTSRSTEKPLDLPAQRLDATDLRIIETLVVDARTSHRALARHVGMSAPAVADRVSRLEAAGVLKGYRAVVDWSALERGLTLIVGIVCEHSADQRALSRRLLGIPEVESVEIVTGSVDLHVRLRVRDQEHLRQVFFDQLLPVPGLGHTDTSLVMAVAEPENHAQTVLADRIRAADDDA